MRKLLPTENGCLTFLERITKILVTYKFDVKCCIDHCKLTKTVQSSRWNKDNKETDENNSIH